MAKDRRLWIIALLLIAVAVSFWGSSRYPSLDAKSSMSGAVALQDALSFNAVFNTSTAPDIVTKIAFTFGNWIYINWQGMAFGLVLATLLLTALPLLQESYSRSRLGSTFLGSMIGIPLGLCVNCSAPMAYGIYRGGGRTETALATMLSSPALNVIVIGMSIALLPFYLWATKLILSLVLIFVCVPVLVNLLAKRADAPSNLSIDQEMLKTDREPCLSILQALLWSIPAIIKNSVSMLLKMVPLMLLAGLIGAIMVTILPWEKLIDLLPMYNVTLIIVAMVLLAVFALILPVPIAFDIVLVATLVSAGLPDRYSGIMLFALGSFSIYSFFVLVKANLRTIGIGISLCAIVLSILSGVISHYWGQYDSYRQKQVWFEVVKNYQGAEHMDSGYQTPILKYKNLNELEILPAPKSRTLPKLPNIVEVVLNKQPQTANSSWHMQASELGFQDDPPPVFWSNLAPYSAFAPLAAANVNGDSWPDLIKGSYSGVQIYINTGGKFQLISSPTLNKLNKLSALAPADLDNDGDSDLVIALFSGEKYLSYNEQGHFSEPVKIDDKSEAYTPVIAIADLDKNTELDIIFGNETVLDLLNISMPESVNTLYMQHDSAFVLSSMPTDLGSTLSILISDIDNNQKPDIFVGNDFDSPDRYYEYNQDMGKFEPWPVSAILETTRTTMSIDTADIDNDLTLEAYIAQVSMESPDKEYLDVKRQASVYERNYGRLLYGFPNPFGDLTRREVSTCDSLESKCTVRNARTQINAAIRTKDLSKCSSLEGNHIWQCAAVALHEFSYRRARFSHLDVPCEDLGQSFPEITTICERMRDKNRFREESDMLNAVAEDVYPQNSLTNILLGSADQIPGSSRKENPKQNIGLKYQDSAEDMGIQYSGWTWNAKFADLDGDQWQDLFIANGWYQMRSDTSNVFFRNILGNRFEIQTEQAGLLDFEPTKSYVYLDIDQDGDLDIVTHNIYGELTGYINQNPNNHIQFEIDDQTGNKSAVGAKIIIEYGGDQKLHQIRELKLSGGYQSFDPLIAHFGLGDHNTVSSVFIQLPDGRKHLYTNSFMSNTRYRITIK